MPPLAVFQPYCGEEEEANSKVYFNDKMCPSYITPICVIDRRGYS